MKTAIIGYGKMGKEIERILVERGHSVDLIVDVDSCDMLDSLSVQGLDVAFEFTAPTTAYENIKKCLELGLPVLSGSTGWLERKGELDELCRRVGGTFFFASNYSIGVNVMFRLNEMLAQIMSNLPQYHLSIEETHHVHKLDAPSGTAVVLAEGIRNASGGKLSVCDQEINSIREGEVAGIHKVAYASDVDVLEIKHSASSRRGLALGAVIAAEWVYDKKGVYEMNDLLKL